MHARGPTSSPISWELSRGNDAIHRAMTLLYAIAIFLAAALLFVVQPLIGRIVLPKLGGSPAVWTTCMVFFQGVLLLGYLYAHVLTTRVRPRTQVIIHTVLLGLAAIALPIRISVGEPSGRPVLWLLATLAIIIGPLFLLISTTGPLLQRWYSLAGGARAADPYFLSIASNAGSAVGLLAYPLLLERLMTRQQQSWWWGIGYALGAALIILCG